LEENRESEDYHFHDKSRNPLLKTDALYRKFERGANGWLGKIHVTALEDKEEPHVDIELGKNGIEFSFTKNELDDLKSYACFKYDQELQASAELTKKRDGASKALDDDDFLELGINSGALLSQLKASEASEASDAEAESDSAHREADKMLRRRLSHSGIKNVALVKQVHAPSKPATPLAVAARAAVQVGAKKVTTPPSGTPSTSTSSSSSSPRQAKIMQSLLESQSAAAAAESAKDRKTMEEQVMRQIHADSELQSQRLKHEAVEADKNREFQLRLQQGQNQFMKDMLALLKRD
jgi:hypothetical protein